MHYKHGYKGTTIYTCWQNMKARCDNPNRTDYKNYGGRGIGYQKSWKDFENFLQDIGKPPTPQHQIERIKNNEDYSKANCCWATKQDQIKNRRMFHNNTSGVSGVSYSQNRWQARVSVNGTRKLLYLGPDFFEAVCARKSMENQLD